MTIAQRRRRELVDAAAGAAFSPRAMPTAHRASQPIRPLRVDPAATRLSIESSVRTGETSETHPLGLLTSYLLGWDFRTFTHRLRKATNSATRASKPQ
jgi:hypothetical protein